MVYSYILKAGFFSKIALYIKNNAVNLGRKFLVMAKRSKYFLVFLLLMFSAKGFSQPKMLSIWNMNSDSTPIHIQSSRFIFSSSKLLVKIPKNFVIAGICSPETYKMGIGFFCKKELELYRITPLHVRFRLGSLEYVNWLEKKPNALYNGR
jgi:hypothetical protein